MNFLQSLKRLLLLSASVSMAQASDYQWSGVGSSCGDTLQQCVNNVADEDTIIIQTDGPIDETITASGKAVSLVAGSGFRPVFSAGNEINIYADGTYSIVGLKLLDGKIKAQSTSLTDANITIENNTVYNSQNTIKVIEYTNSGSNMVNDYVRIAYNHILGRGSELPVGIGFVSYNNGADIEVEIYGNTINMTDGIGISMTNVSDGSLQGYILGNDVKSQKTGINLTANKGYINMPIVSNAVRCLVQVCANGDGITASVTSATSAADYRVINNTILGYKRGISLFDGEGVLSADLYNNLISDTSAGGISVYLDGLSEVHNDYNLIYNNGEANANYVAGANDITTFSPKLNLYGRLDSVSPAIDAGDASQLTMPDLPYVDADGWYRESDGDKNGVVKVDIGAFEFGANIFQHTHSGTLTAHTYINHESTNSEPGLGGFLHATSQFNADGTTTGNQNLDTETFFYNGGTNKWALFNQDEVNMRNGALFNIAHLAKTYTTFEHKVTAAENFSIINKTGLNNRADKVLQVTPYWDGSTSDYNPHPTGISYSEVAGKWRIFTMDEANMPINSNFNVYYQDTSRSAWKHVASLANRHPVGIYHFTTLLDHPLLNGNRCAQIQVTQDLNGAVYNNTPIGVWYDNNIRQWSIFNQDYSAMPVGATFHVLINPGQIEACTDMIFKNGF